MAISKLLIPFFSAAAVFLLLLHSAAAQPAVVRGGYWFPDSGFAVSAIESRHFTHLFCAFAGIDSGNFQLTVPAANRQQFMTFTQTVQSKNPSVRTLLSIGGGGAGANSTAFALMAGNSTTRQVFINSSVSLARSYGFDGLDLDWEFPSSGEEMASFALLVMEWRRLVEFEALMFRKPLLILTAAVYYSSVYYTSPSAIYPIQAISNNLDWINVMSYDLYAPNWSPNSTAPPAALYGSDQVISVDSGIRSWLQQGLPATKIVLGLPFYGYAWQLLNSNQTGLYLPANGTDLPEGGAMTYGQINRFIEGWKSSVVDVFSATVVTKYCYYGTTWIGYDSSESIFGKVLYAKVKGLGGYFAWHVGGDDNWTLSTTGNWSSSIIQLYIFIKIICHIIIMTVFGYG
ncbi:Class V chitinase [Linum perenne]